MYVSPPSQDLCLSILKAPVKEVVYVPSGKTDRMRQAFCLLRCGETNYIVNAAGDKGNTYPLKMSSSFNWGEIELANQR
jgi:hypothetical protein